MAAVTAEAMEEEIMAVVTAEAMEEEIMAAVTVEAMEEEIMAATVEEIMAATVEEIMAATVEEILNLILLIQTNPPEQKVGKIEVMETLQKTLNMRVEEVEEKGVFLMRVTPQMREISNPFLLAYKLI